MVRSAGASNAAAAEADAPIMVATTIGSARAGSLASLAVRSRRGGRGGAHGAHAVGWPLIAHASSLRVRLGWRRQRRWRSAAGGQPGPVRGCSLQSRLTAAGRGRGRYAGFVPTGGADALNSLPTTTARFVRALPLVAGRRTRGVRPAQHARASLGAVLLVAILLLAAALAFWSAAGRPGGADRAALDRDRRVCCALRRCSSSSSASARAASSRTRWRSGALAVGVLLVVRLGLGRAAARGDRPGGARAARRVSPASPAGRCCRSSGRTLPAAPTIALRPRPALPAHVCAVRVGRAHARAAGLGAARRRARDGRRRGGGAALAGGPRRAGTPRRIPQAKGRLAYPLTYWNALGVFCAVAAVLCVHLAAADDRRRVRVLGAGALPVLGATLLLTYSRGGLAVAVIGLAALRGARPPARAARRR